MKENEKNLKGLMEVMEKEIPKAANAIRNIFDKIDINKIINNFQKVFQFIKTNSATAFIINNEKAQEQIEKEISSLQKKVGARNRDSMEF